MNFSEGYKIKKTIRVFSDGTMMIHLDLLNQKKTCASIRSGNAFLVKTGPIKMIQRLEELAEQIKDL